VGKAQTGGLYKQGADDGIWGQEVGSNRRQDKLHNEELHGFSSLLNIIRMIKSRMLRQKGHVKHTGTRREIHTAFWQEHLKEKGHLIIFPVTG